MGLGPSASRPSGHNTKRSAAAGRFFICCIASRKLGLTSQYGKGAAFRSNGAAKVQDLCAVPTVAASRSGARRDGRLQRDFESLKKSARTVKCENKLQPRIGARV